MNNTLKRRWDIDTCCEEISLNQQGFDECDNDDDKQYYQEELDYWIDRLQELVTSN